MSQSSFIVIPTYTYQGGMAGITDRNTICHMNERIANFILRVYFRTSLDYLAIAVGSS